jgi:glycosyltransferase involved in cell wall biosynthesis
MAISGKACDVSVVLPVFNEQHNLEHVFDEIRATLSGENFEVIAVDDGSTDKSVAVIEANVTKDPRFRLVSLERNSGQSFALLAGLDIAGGAIVATMDSDGQNDPADLPELLAVLRSDGDIAAVVGYRTRRRDSAWTMLQSRIANRVRDLITGDRVRDTGCSLRVMRRCYIEGLLRFDGMHRFIPTLIRAQGGRVAEKPVGHRPRTRGESNYRMWNRVFGALSDAFRVRKFLRQTRVRKGIVN